MRLRFPPNFSILQSPSGLEIFDRYFPGRVLDGGMLLQPAFLALLQYCSVWRAKREAIEFLAETAQLPLPDASKAIANLMDVGVLATDVDQQLRKIAGRINGWDEKGWEEPFLFHFSTNTHPKLDYTDVSGFLEDVAQMRAKVAAGHPPANHKSYENRPRLRLNRPEYLSEDTVAGACRDEVGGSDRVQRPMSTAEFSWLTYYAFGQTGTRALPVTGQHVGKTSPSGGSRHPTEVYPVIFDVDGIQPGLYHYDVKSHSLDALEETPSLDFVKRCVVFHLDRPEFPIRVAYLLTTIFERSMFRYREPFSYRVVHHDLGHLMQTTAFLASAISRRSYRTYSVEFGEIDKLLRIDGFTESSMASIIIG